MQKNNISHTLTWTVLCHLHSNTPRFYVPTVAGISFQDDDLIYYLNRDFVLQN